MRLSLRWKAACFAWVMLTCSYFCGAVQWLPFGPYGGDARAITQDVTDNHHLYLGTVDGWIYESHDGGGSWRRLARVGNRDDLVLDSIVVDQSDPKHLVIGAWVLGRPDGGIFISHDAGASWSASGDMKGQSIRALAAAPSDPKVFIAGTLQGVFRSMDGGLTWKRITPEGSQELHEVESIAVDPKDPQVIYAGTWHLPWKTTDGGNTWSNIKQGIIDDSDVFSIIVDPAQPQVVYASACSGIYKSDDAGSLFHKVQGIPSTARRTRVLMQDPQHPLTVYAGTTEGLFRTDDGGNAWVRTTGPDVIVNDVYIDPKDSQRVLIATDRGGILASNDRGNTFDPSNNGFSTRQITSYITERNHPENIDIGLVNDKQFGGVFHSSSGGLSWSQQSGGLSSHDVFSLAQAADGTLVAGTGHGLYRFKDGQWIRVLNIEWNPSNATLNRGASQARQKRKVGGAALASRTHSLAVKKQIGQGYDGKISSIAGEGDFLYAATTDGLLKSTTVSADKWEHVDTLKLPNLLRVASYGGVIFASGLSQFVESEDGGKTWNDITLPESLAQASAIAVTPSGELWTGGRGGLFYSKDKGATWKMLPGILTRDINSLFYDAGSQRLFATVGTVSTLAYAVYLPDHVVHYWDTGWNLRFVRPVGDHLVAATLFDGIVVQPRMVDSENVVRR